MPASQRWPRGRAAAVWGEKDERKASLARPQQSPSRGGDSGDDPGSDDQLSGSRGVSTAWEAVSVVSLQDTADKACMHLRLLRYVLT